MARLGTHPCFPRGSDSISQMPVVDDDGKLMGIIGEVDLLTYLLSGDGAIDHPIYDIISRDVATVSADTPIDTLSEIAGKGGVAVVVDDERKPEAIVIKIDLIDYLTSKR